jgi:hypothetical protein
LLKKAGKSNIKANKRMILPSKESKMVTNNTDIQKSINNISRRFRDYDKTQTKYAFDVHYSITHSPGEYVKAKRVQGADVFNSNINDLLENYEDVSTITVSDYCGKAANARRINPPVVIRLTDEVNEEQIEQPT